MEWAAWLNWAGRFMPRENLMATKNDNPPDVPAAVDSPTTSPAATIETPRGADSRILDRLLKMADGYRKDGALRQAETMYIELIQNHAGTPQAQQARDRLMKVCEEYERQGKLHHARWLYEQLL